VNIILYTFDKQRSSEKKIALFFLFFLIISDFKAYAQVNDTPSFEITVQDSIFTDAQVQRGIKVYQSLCAECHMPVQFTMDVFTNTWNGRYLFEIYELIRTTMPYENPGRLSKKEVADVLSYILSLNNLQSGQSDLPTTSSKLKQIRIENLSQRKEK
jgi:mono/diheme cytochrome c family protein